MRLFVVFGRIFGCIRIYICFIFGSVFIVCLGLCGVVVFELGFEFFGF